MSLNQRLELRQGQSLVMTPQLQQAIKLLQMSTYELQSFVESELERNPLLERDEASDGPIETPEQPQDQSSASTEADFTSTIGDDAATTQKLETMDTDLANVYADEAKADVDAGLSMQRNDSSWSSLKSSSGSFDGQAFDLEATLSEEQTLADHLTEQLNLAISDPAQRMIGLHLIGMLNDDGYLKADLETLQEQLKVSPEKISRVLDVVRGFEPAGVFCPRPERLPGHPVA